MATTDDLSALFAYNRWADETMLNVVGQLSADDYIREPVPGWASIRSTIVHGADALDIWARRLDGQTVTTRTTEASLPTFDDAARFLRAGHDTFLRLILGMTPERLASDWEYRDLAGALYRMPYWAVFRHVVNHATYHRGQVAAKLKRLGVDPPSTDLAAWVRVKIPEGEKS
jgi:uncharacterized damage-inducible protein DinB